MACLLVHQRTMRYLVALLPRGVVAVGVREVDVTGSDPHDVLDVPAPFTDHMGVLSVGHVHLKGHLVHLVWGEKITLSNQHLKSGSQISISSHYLKSPSQINISCNHLTSPSQISISNQRLK